MCSLNGWGVGTKVRRTSAAGEHYDMEITALGEGAVLVKYLNHDIEGEAIMYSAFGDTFTEILTQEERVEEIRRLQYRLLHLLEALE